MADLFTLDDIFPLILFLIAIVSVIAKAVTKAKPSARKTVKPAAPSQLQQKLQGFFADIQAKLEAQNRKSAAGSSQWRRLGGENKADGSISDTYEMSLEDLVLEDEEEPARPAEKPPLRPAGVQIRPPEKQPAAEWPDLGIQEHVLPRAALDRTSLRKAIVWSEILGPPVALRKFPGNR